jgi:hypothetical protein
MKSKVLRIVLVGLVLTVWGAVIERAFVRPEVPSEAPSTASPTVPRSPARVDAEVHYTLARDPFLEGVQVAVARSTNSRSSSGPKAARAIPSEVRAPVVPWPSITINGILRATDGPHYIATATINGKGHVLRVGQQAGPVLVQAIMRDSVRLELGDAQRTFPSSVSW